MRVCEILNKKGDAVFKISQNESLADVVARMVNFNCGSLVVCDENLIVGIITERDILKSIESQKKDLCELLVCNFMSRNLIVGHPLDEVGEIMGKMTSNRIRHLPIFDDERLVGLISIGDVVKAMFEVLVEENHYLKVYIQG